METKPIKLYFDYKSPFAYLAKDEAYQLEDDYPVQIEWLPYVVNIPEVYGDLQTRDQQQWRKGPLLVHGCPALGQQTRLGGARATEDFRFVDCGDRDVVCQEAGPVSGIPRSRV